jgi:hypothetical protein
MRNPTHAENFRHRCWQSSGSVASMGPHAPGSINTIPSHHDVSMATALTQVLCLSALVNGGLPQRKSK